MSLHSNLFHTMILDKMTFVTLLFAAVAPVCCSKWCMQWNLNYKLWKLCHAIYEHSLTVLVISIRNSLLFLESKALEVGLVKCKVCDLQLPIRKLNVEWNRPPHTIYDCPPDYLGGYWPIGRSMQIYQNTVEMNWSSTQPTGFGIYFL